LILYQLQQYSKLFQYFFIIFWGIDNRLLYSLARNTPMKEQLESNILTKYAAGLMEAEELSKLEDWLKQNPQFRTTLALIQQNVMAMTMQMNLVRK